MQPKRRWGRRTGLILLILVVVGVCLTPYVHRRILGCQVKEKVLAASAAPNRVTVFYEQQLETTAEFYFRFWQALSRATVSFDPERTREQWLCGCAFSVVVDVEGHQAILDQHHLFFDGRYYHLSWADDLSYLIEACESTP